MKFALRFDDSCEHLVDLMRQDARSGGWAGTPGLKTWAREAHQGTLRTNRYGDLTSISFKTQQQLEDFKQHYGIEPTQQCQATKSDILGRPISVGDYVVYNSRVYRVLVVDLGQGYLDSHIRIQLTSHSVIPVVKPAAQCCLLPREDVMMWLLKRDYSA